MSRLIPGLLVVLTLMVLPASASAAPEGFRESWRLEPVARAHGHPEAAVYCARTPAIWRDANPGNANWSTLNGKVAHAEKTMYLPPWTCQPLELWKRGKTVPLADLGRALLTFAHESVHLRGVRDEHEAECTGLRELRDFSRRYFGIKREVTWRAVWKGALADHADAPPEQQNC